MRICNFKFMVPLFILVHYPNILEPRSGATVNHKIVSSLYKTECRLLLVLIQIFPRNNPGILHFPPKQNQSTEKKIFISCFSSENSYKFNKYLFSEV